MLHLKLTRYLAALCFLCFTNLTFAQSTGEVTGIVTDPNAAVIPGAELRLTNAQTGVSTNTVANGEGLYRFANLQPGTYQLGVTSANFAETRLNDVTVEVARTTRVDVQLQVAGAVQEQVTVTAGTQLLDLDSGTKGQIINSKQIENLPLQSRNPLALTTLTPGVVSAGGGTVSNRQGSDGTGISSIYAINGGVRTGNGGFNEFLVDGISVTNRRDGVVLALPASDSLQQFQVQSGGMSAEFGHTVGGVINYVTKGGTNDFHGNLFESHRSTATNARRALPASSDKPRNIFNQFGGSIGGPVILPRFGEGGPASYDGRNRTFFFFNYEGSRWVRNNPQTATIPTARMRGGDFSELSTPIFDPASSATPASRVRFPGNIIPAARINPFGQRILDTFPLPNLPGLANNYAGLNTVYTPVDNYTGRIDHSLTERQRATFKFTRVNSTSIASFPLGDVDQQTQNVVFPTRNYTISYNYTISPTLLYSATAGYTQFRRNFLDASGNTVGAGFFGFSVTPQPSGVANVRPAAAFDIYRGIGTGGAQNQLGENFQINQSLSYVRGKHTFRFGADLRRYYSAGFITGGAANGSFGFSPLQTSNGAAGTGNAVASLLLGLANTFNLQQVPDIRLGINTPAVFITDDYKISPNLVVNLGLRYDIEGQLSERYNRVGYFDSTTTNPLVNRRGVFQYAGLNGNPRTITSGDYNNFGPRVGFAYAPGAGDKKTVFRGAFGAYYSPIPTVGFYSAAPGFETTFNPIKPNATAPAIVLTSNYTLPSPSGPEGDAASLGLPLAQPLDRSIKNPIVYQWNIGVQREVAKNLVFEILYSGNRGSHLIDNQSINPPSQALIEQAISIQQASGVSGSAQAFLNQTIPNPLAGRVPSTFGAATITRVNASRPFPQYGTISSYQNSRDSIYHSLQSKLEKRLSNDLNFLLAYTFSKEIDNAISSTTADRNIGTEQNLFDLRDARGVGSFDRTHNFAGSMVYSLPFGKGRRFLDSGALSRFVGGFQLTGILTMQSGIPVAVSQSEANGLGLGAARPDAVGDVEQLSRAVRGTINPNGSVQWIARDAYRVANGRFGTAPIRDSRLRGPSFYQLDFGLQRDFNFSERTFVRFRAEAFNVLNHTNLGFPEQNINSPAFGQINSVYDPRIFQFGLELKF